MEYTQFGVRPAQATKAATFTNKGNFSVRIADKDEKLYFSMGMKQHPSSLDPSDWFITDVPALVAASYACAYYRRLPEVPSGLELHFRKAKHAPTVSPDEAKNVMLYGRVVGSTVKSLEGEGKIVFQEQRTGMTLYRFDNRIDVDVARLLKQVTKKP